MRPLAAPSGDSRTSSLPMRKRASAAVSTSSSARVSGVWPCRLGAFFKPSRSTKCARKAPRLERIAEILRLAGHFSVAKLHDAHRVRRPPVAGPGSRFGDPEVAHADDPPHGEAFAVRLCRARRLDIVPPAQPLARLRIVEHRILAIDRVLRIEVVGVGRGPVAIQSCANVCISQAPPVREL